MSHFKFAAVVTEDNKQSIIDHVAKFNLNVSDDLDGIIEFYTPSGEEPMAYFSYSDRPHGGTAAFTVIGSKSFYRMYEFDYERMEGPFTQAHSL